MNRSSVRGRVTRAPRKAPVVIEALENRQLLSAVLQAKPVVDTLMITGTARADVITVGADDTYIGVTINGVVQQFDKSVVKAIIIRAGGGNDTVKIDETYGQLPVGVQIFGDGGGDQITGSSLNDTLNGGGGLDYVFGGGGDDVIVGLGGNDYLWGEAGNDWIAGGNGDDALHGGDGNDTLLGAGGSDNLLGGAGINVENGGGGYNNVNNQYAGGVTPLMRPLTNASDVTGTTTTGPGNVGPSTEITTPFGYDVNLVRTAYQFGDLNDPGFTNRGAGQGIAIVIAYDTPTAFDDLTTFSLEYGLPLPTAQSFQVVYAEGIRPPTDPEVIQDDNDDLYVLLNGWSAEANLDVQWAHAIAPEATIYLVEAASNMHADMVTAIDVASQVLMRNHGGGVVNMSFGALSEASAPAYEKVFNKSAYRNVTYVAAAGDIPAISHPATSPRVLSVGGTNLRFLPFQGDQLPDVAWEFTGGGMSTTFSIPSYQNGVEVVLSEGAVGTPIEEFSSFRVGPDVAYNAGEPVSVYSSFLTVDWDGDADDSIGFSGLDTGWGAWAGTSAGAPQWAGIIALANQQRVAAGKSLLGNRTHDLIYSLADRARGSFFQDVVSNDEVGNIASPALNVTAGLPAGLGFDMSTGWGVPRASSLIDALAANDPMPNSSVSGGFTSVYREATSKFTGGNSTLWGEYRGVMVGSIGPNAVTLTFTVTQSFNAFTTGSFTITVPRLSNTTFGGIATAVSVEGPVTTTLFNMRVDGTIRLNRAGAYAVEGTFEGLDPATNLPMQTGIQETFVGRFYK